MIIQQKSKNVPIVATTEINVEKIIGMKPDLVLGHASMMSYNKDAYDQIKKSKHPAVRCGRRARLRCGLQNLHTNRRPNRQNKRSGEADIVYESNR